MKICANSVLFGGYDLETAFNHLALAGYDGIELSALDGMSEHLVIDRWQELVPDIKRFSQVYGIELLAIQASSQDKSRMEQTFRAAAELGIRIIHCDPGGKADDEAYFLQMIDSFGNLTRMAEKYDVNLCTKAHVGAGVYNTATSLRLLQSITSPAFGINVDPSHIYRSGENPVEALTAVLPRVKHSHIRDCKGRQSGPGKPEDQANGRGDIDLLGFIRILHEADYSGAISLEVIGAKQYSLVQCAMIAAEARGHMQACLQACVAR
jgi:sugar phosphate isomerase/epimerase